MTIETAASLVTLTSAGTTYSNMSEDALAAAGLPAAAISAAVNAAVVAAADREIDALCDRAFTRSASRAERYARKYSEALAYREADYPGNVSQDDYPFLIAEAAALEITKRQQADRVIAAAQGFAQLGALAEAARAAVRLAIAGAETLAGKREAARAHVTDLAAAIAAATTQAEEG